MKRLTTLVAVIVLASPVHAEVTSREQATESVCNDIFDIAHKIMEARQVGVEIPKLRAVANRNSLFPNLMHDMITEAYTITPRIQQKAQDKLSTEFANQWSLSCYQTQGINFD